MQNWLQIKQLRLFRGSPHFVTIRSLAAPRRSMYCHNSSPPPLSYFLFTTHDSAIEEISETALIQPSLELARAQSLLCSLDSRCAHHRRAARTPRVDRESKLTSK